MKRTTITIIDIIAYLVNDLLAWFIVIWFDVTGYDNKFQNIRLHWLILIIGIIHIIALFVFNVHLDYHINSCLERT